MRAIRLESICLLLQSYQSCCCTQICLPCHYSETECNLIRTGFQHKGIHTLSSAANTNATKGCVCLARVSFHTGPFLANSGSATKGCFVDAGVERSTRGRNTSHSSALWLDDANNHQCHWRLHLWWAGHVCHSTTEKSDKSSTFHT